MSIINLIFLNVTGHQCSNISRITGLPRYFVRFRCPGLKSRIGVMLREHPQKKSVFYIDTDGEQIVFGVDPTIPPVRNILKTLYSYNIGTQAKASASKSILGISVLTLLTV